MEIVIGLKLVPTNQMWIASSPTQHITRSECIDIDEDSLIEVMNIEGDVITLDIDSDYEVDISRDSLKSLIKDCNIL